MKMKPFGQMAAGFVLTATVASGCANGREAESPSSMTMTDPYSMSVNDILQRTEGVSAAHKDITKRLADPTATVCKKEYDACRYELSSDFSDNHVAMIKCSEDGPNASTDRYCKDVRDSVIAGLDGKMSCVEEAKACLDDDNKMPSAGHTDSMRRTTRRNDRPHRLQAHTTRNVREANKAAREADDVVADAREDLSKSCRPALEACLAEIPSTAAAEKQQKACVKNPQTVTEAMDMAAECKEASAAVTAAADARVACVDKADDLCDSQSR